MGGSITVTGLVLVGLQTTNKDEDKTKAYHSFEEAREFVHDLSLHNVDDWKEDIKSDNKPENIPSS